MQINPEEIKELAKTQYNKRLSDNNLEFCMQYLQDNKIELIKEVIEYGDKTNFTRVD